MSPIITNDMIQRAKEEADQAAQQLVIAEAETAVWTGPLTPQAAEQLGRLTARTRAATIRVDQLTAMAEQQRAELAARQAAELKADKYLTKATAELTGSKQRLAESVAAAEAALVTAVRMAQAHNALVERHRTEVVALGLTGQDGADHDTMACGHEDLRIRGTWWLTFDPGAVLARSARVIANALLGDQHMVTLRLSHIWGGDRLDRSGVLDGVPALTPDKRPKRLVARAARIVSPVWHGEQADPVTGFYPARQALDN